MGFFNKKQKTITEKDFQIRDQKMRVQEESWEREKDLLERQQKMQEERKSFKPAGKSTTTTKWIVRFLFINCTLVELFTAWATYKSLMISELLGTYADFSPLVALIGAVIGEVMGFAVYAVKASKENSVGGVTYLKAQQELEILPSSDEDETALEEDNNLEAKG